MLYIAAFDYLSKVAAILWQNDYWLPKTEVININMK